MPIGKDSITKRVAKIETTVPSAQETEKVEKTESAPKTTATTHKKKTPAKETTTSKAPAKTVIANIAPETVAAVIGHKENTKFKKVEIGTDLPYYLL